MMARRKIFPLIVLGIVLILLIGLLFLPKPSGEEIDQALASATENLGAVTVLVAFVGGLATILAPCVFPILVAILGASVPAARGERLLRRGLLFLAGFGIVFFAIGYAVSAAGQFLRIYQEALTTIAGIFLVLAGGSLLLGTWRVRGGTGSRWQMARGRWHVVRETIGYALRATSSPLQPFFLGLAFGIGWAPCVGPILFSILVLAAREADVGRTFPLLLAYFTGLSLPFVAFFFVAERTKFLARFRGELLARGAGILLVFIGVIYLLFGGSTVLNQDLLGLWERAAVWQGWLLNY